MGVFYLYKKSCFNGGSFFIGIFFNDSLCSNCYVLIVIILIKLVVLLLFIFIFIWFMY